MKEEIWKDIAGYEGLYQVSNLGRVKSLDRYLECARGAFRLMAGRILKPTIDKKGYLYVKLYNAPIKKRYFIHQLVAKSFISNPNKLSIVNHKDENPSNNIFSNLEWCTAKYNFNYGTAKDRMIQSQLNHPKASIPVAQKDLKGNIIKIYPSAKEAYRQTGIPVSNISACRNKDKEHKTAGGFIWDFV